LGFGVNVMPMPASSGLPMKSGNTSKGSCSATSCARKRVGRRYMSLSSMYSPNGNSCGAASKAPSTAPDASGSAALAARRHERVAKARTIAYTAHTSASTSSISGWPARHVIAVASASSVAQRHEAPRSPRSTDWNSRSMHHSRPGSIAVTAGCGCSKSIKCPVDHEYATAPKAAAGRPTPQARRNP
jgi:hypothetical protein